MRVMVTGASGFIGTPLVRMLARQGHEIIEVLRATDSGAGHPPSSIVWDISRRERPQNLPSRVDAIVHLAQARNYRAFPTSAADMFLVNVHGTAALLDYAAEIGARRFCFVSSGTVYEPYRGELTEDAALDPPSYLGASKLAAEILARPYSSLFELSILRLFFPYGPGQRDRLVPDLIHRVRNGVPVQLTSDGEGLRLVPTFVEDIAEIISASAAEGWSGTFNVASPTPVSIRALAEAIGDCVGRKPVFELTEGTPPVVVPSVDRLRSRFDFARFTPLQQGLARVLASTA